MRRLGGWGVRLNRLHRSFPRETFARIGLFYFLFFFKSVLLVFYFEIGMKIGLLEWNFETEILQRTKLSGKIGRKLNAASECD